MRRSKTVEDAAVEFVGGSGLAAAAVFHLHGVYGRVSALPKTAPALALQMERLFWWSWSRFRKCLAKQLHLLD